MATPPVRVAPSGPLAEAGGSDPLSDMAGYTFFGSSIGADSLGRDFCAVADPKGVVPPAGNNGLATLELAPSSVKAPPAVYSAGVWGVDVDLTVAFSSGSAATNSYITGALQINCNLLDANGAQVAYFPVGVASNAPSNSTYGFDKGAVPPAETSFANAIGESSVRRYTEVPLAVEFASFQIEAQRVDDVGAQNIMVGTTSGVLEVLDSACVTIRKVG